MHACWDQRLTSAIFFNPSPLYSLRQLSHWTYNSLIRLPWLAGRCPGSSGLDLTCTGITGHTTKPSFCVGAGDLRLGPRVLRQAVYQRVGTVLVTVVLAIVTRVLRGKSCRSSLYQLYQQYSLPPTAHSYPQLETQARPEDRPLDDLRQLLRFLSISSSTAVRGDVAQRWSPRAFWPQIPWLNALPRGIWKTANLCVLGIP